MMRGNFGAGFEMGTGFGLTTQSYASAVSITYDNVRNIYIGEMTSRGGVYRIEGPDRGSIDTDMEQIAREEYSAMVKEVSTKKKQDFGSDAGRVVTVHGQRAHVTRHMEAGVPVLVMAASSGPGSHHKKGSGLTKALDVVEVTDMIYSAISGDWFKALFSGILMIFEDELSKSGGEQPAKIFAAEFGGVLITAATRALLKKKLLLQKNRRIQIIMQHMRDHDQARDKAANIGSYIAERILEKRREAEMKWSNQVSPQGEETGWRGRSLNLRKNLELKRNKAQTLWSARV